MRYGPLNILDNVNGERRWVDSHDSFIELLEDLGISAADAHEYMSCEFDECPKGDGVYGDDFYELCRAIDDCAQGLGDLADRLNEPSCKGNTRADIAIDVRSVASNLACLV